MALQVGSKVRFLQHQATQYPGEWEVVEVIDEERFRINVPGWDVPGMPRMAFDIVYLQEVQEVSG